MNTEIQKINVENIVPNRFQPRKNFDEESLEELANSIRQHGIIQPLVLRKLKDKYEIIAGERRYKAALKIGLKEVPAIVMELDDTSSAEIALVENIQRKDLTAIEEAKSYEKILELGQMSQDELAKRVGKKQSTVSNKLRLLNLSEEAQKALLDNKISERHARSLLRLKDKDKQNEMLNKIIDNRLTVRETDLEIKKQLGETKQDSDFDDEIIDFQPDIPIVKDQEPDIPSVEPSTENTINSSNNLNNQVYINSDIVPPEDITPININTANSPEASSIAESFTIPEYDQIGINQNNNINSQTTNNYDNQSSQVNTNSLNQQPVPQKGKFFNLDDEAANMNMGNTFSSNNYIDSSQFIPNGMPNFNEHQTNYQNNYQEPINNQNIVEQNVNIPPQPMIPQQDITGAVAVIRNTIMNLQNNGYIINISEQDNNGSHQIVIDIRK